MSTENVEMKNTNLDLWHKVEKTNPAYTKNANVRGNKITSISPQYQIMNVTEQFGIYGTTWGFEDTVHDYTLAKDFGLIVLDATFFFPGGKFKIKNSINLYIDNARTKIDADFAKKLETDTLTKAISKLGFNADIFMGKFDDVKYVDDMNKEFNPPPPEPTIEELLINALSLVESATEIKALNKVFADNPKLKEEKSFIDAIKKKRESLTPKQ